MVKLLSGVFVVSAMTIACSSQTNKKEDEQQGSAKTNVETKTNTSSSAAKSNEQGDSAVFIRPIHKYKHQKKFKLK